MKDLILFFALATFLGCSPNSHEEAVEVQVDLMKVPPPSTENPYLQEHIVDKSVAGRKLIKEGYLEFETSDIERTRNQIIASVSANGAYISSDQERKSADKISYTIIVRIPSVKFDAFLNSATKDVGYFDNKEINVKDVTAEYLDTQIRLKTKKEIESRYLQLLGKASSVKDVLDIEKELGTIRTEIESAEGQLKLLTDQVQYSTLRINFYKISSTPAIFSFQIKSAFIRGWENLLTGFIMLIDVWPFLILAIGLWFGFKAIQRKKLKKRLIVNTIN